MSHSLKLTAPGWRIHEQSAAWGQAFTPNGMLLRAKELATMFNAQTDAGSWRAALAGLNGCFAVAAVRDLELYAAVDRVRSFPLFYGRALGGTTISDDAELLHGMLSPFSLDQSSHQEFERAGYVTGASPLYTSLRQIRAALGRL